VKKEEKMRTKFAIALAIVAVCVTAAWAGWNDEFQVTDNELENWTGATAAHTVVIGDGGVVHMVWFVGDDAYYKRYYPGSGWSEELILGSGHGKKARPGIALDANGKDIHVVWQSGRSSGRGKNKTEDMTIYYRKCVVTGPGNGGWDENPTDLCVNAGDCWHRYDPCIACGASGQVVVAWQEGHFDGSPLAHSVRFREYVSGEWQDEQVIAGPSDESFWEQAIAADGNGDVFVSYILSLDGSYKGHVFVARRIDGVWQDPENLTPGDDRFYRTAIEVSPQTGNPHLVCMSKEINGADVRHIYHTYCTDDGWEPLVMISDPSVERDNGPHMCFTGGAAHVVWYGDEDSDLVYDYISYASCPYEGGTWTDPVELVTNDVDGVVHPDIASGTDGTLFAVWTRKSTRADTIGNGKKKWIIEVTETQIWGKYNTPGGDGGSAKPMALSQSCFGLFPNPAKAGRVAIHYSLPHAGQIAVKLLDVSGRAVRTQEVTTNDQRGSFSIDVSGLSTGVYVARLVAGDISVSKSLVVGR
jgi:hypothetical protein